MFLRTGAGLFQRQPRLSTKVTVPVGQRWSHCAQRRLSRAWREGMCEEGLCLVPLHPGASASDGGDVCLSSGRDRPCQSLNSSTLRGRKQDPGTPVVHPCELWRGSGSLGSCQSRGDRKGLFCRWLVRILSDPPQFFPIAGIPTLIVLDPKGEVITRQGRVEVLNDVECREFPWHPKPVLELTDSNAVQLNEGPCLVLFVGTERPEGARLSHGGVCWRTPLSPSLRGWWGAWPGAALCPASSHTLCEQHTLLRSADNVALALSLLPFQISF